MKQSLSCVFLLTHFFFVSAQSFQKLVLEQGKFDNISVNRSVYQASDGTVWTVGNMGWEKAVVFQSDKAGEILQAYAFSLPATTDLLLDFKDICLLRSGEIRVAGNMHRGGGATPFLLRLDQDLNPMGLLEIGPYLAYGGYSDWNPRIISGPEDEVYMLHGFFSNGQYSAHLLKVNPQGALEWNIKLGEQAQRQPFWVIELAENGLLLGGEYLLKLDFFGNLLWRKAFLQTDIFALQSAPRKGIFLTGSYQDGSQVDRIFLAQLTESGDGLWARQYDSLPRRPAHYEQSLNLVYTEEEDLVFSYVVTKDRKNIVVKTDLQGAPYWAAQIEANDTYLGNRISSMVETTNQHLLISLWEGRLYQLNSEGDNVACIPIPICVDNESFTLSPINQAVPLPENTSVISRQGNPFNRTPLLVDLVDTCIQGDAQFNRWREITAAFTMDSVACLGDELLVQVPILPIPPDEEYWETNAFGDSLSSAGYLFDERLENTGVFWLRRTIRVFGCWYSYEQTFRVVAPPSLELGSPIEQCGLDPVTLGPENSSLVSEYYWSTGERTANIVVQESGSYWVRGSTSAGCSDRDTISVKITPYPSVEVGADTVVCGTSYTLQPDFVGGLLWSDNLTDSVRVVTRSGIWELTASNECGAMKDTIEVEFTNCLVNVFVPNVFSPNEDGINDQLEVYSNLAEVRELQVYSRWGEMMHRSKSPLIGWDGTFGGQPCQSGVYTYLVKYTNQLTGRLELKAGDVTLLR